jgi:phospholipid-translocating ATPase
MGDILEIHKDDVFPADMLLLYAENDSNEAVDMIFVDTMNLDGETNLKPRTIADSRIKTRDDLHNLSAHLEYDAPHENLDKWDGKLTHGGKSKSANIENLLLRGCTLKNINHAYGVIIYVGAQTKVMKNTKKAPQKVSNMMKLMNFFLYSVFGLQLVMIVILSSISVAWKS